MSEMLEKVARAIRDNIKVDATGMAPVIASAYIVGIEEAAAAAVRALREADNDMLQAMHEAMFVDEFTGTDLPMLGEGFAAAIDSILSTPTTRGEVK